MKAKKTKEFSLRTESLKVPLFQCQLVGDSQAGLTTCRFSRAGPQVHFHLGTQVSLFIKLLM